MIPVSEILSGRIHIVDDPQANVRMLERLLGEAGYTPIASTTTPQEVCELHRKSSYDLILLDLQMPGMDGFQIIEALKTNQDDPYLPVIVPTTQPGHKLRESESHYRSLIELAAGQAGRNDGERALLRARIAARQACLDFVFGCQRPDGQTALRNTRCLSVSGRATALRRACPRPPLRHHPQSCH